MLRLEFSVEGVEKMPREIRKRKAKFTTAAREHLNLLLRRSSYLLEIKAKHADNDVAASIVHKRENMLFRNAKVVCLLCARSFVEHKFYVLGK